MMNKWKHWLSYVWDIQVDFRSSEYNPDLIVYLSQGRYQLCTKEAIYSHEDKYYNFRKILRRYVNYDGLKGKKVLILGLGLGSIPILLDQLDPGQWDITAVEIDEEVINLAQVYGFPKIQSPISVVSADAAVYVKICQDFFDLICVDIFVGEHTPQKFRTLSFLETLDAMTNPGGMVIYNTLANTSEDRKASKDFYQQVFKKIYPSSKSINAHRNYMLLSHQPSMNQAG